MKSKEIWKPSKYIYHKNKLIASRDRKEVGVGSRLIADLVANAYEENLKKHAKGQLLDLGCGHVPLYAAYKNYITKNICVDWENTAHKNVYLDFVCDITKPLPFSDEEFDTIILSDVLEHIAEPELLLKELARILSPGGKVLINVPFYYWLHEQPHDYYRYTEFALKRFINQVNLKLIYLNPIGGAPEVLADIVSKNFLNLRIIGRPLAIFTQWIAMMFIKTKFGARQSTKTASSFPFGYFLIAEKEK